MKIIIAIIVFNRHENIKRWLECWPHCEQKGELVVIHNYEESDTIKELCDKAGVKYIRRENKGFDIGAFQDVCMERLQGFDNDWDQLLWCTDDIFPMTKDFITPYLKGGLVCTDLSPYVKTHIRTTGFMISKQTSLKIKFDVDPVLTKTDCYNFEHQSRNAFYEQMVKLGVKVSQVSNREDAPLWDSGYKRRLPREKEQYNFTRDKVTFICPVYNSYPEIISSLLTQTHKNWELILIHDGPNSTGIKSLINDPRIQFIETPERLGKWGHYIRKWALENIDKLSPGTDYVVITNADNYHVPVYCEYMVRELKKGAVAAYCSDMVHSYIAWKIIPCSLKRGFMDCAGVMVRKEVAVEVGWRDIENHSSDWIYFEDIIKKYGSAWAKVTGCLLIHN